MEPVTSKTPQRTSVRNRPSDVRYPFYSLADSLAVAKVIHEKGGGMANRDQLAAFLGHKTTNSGAFLSRIAAARLFNLINGRGSEFVISPLAQKILMPVYPEQTQEGLVEAFLTVPLFKAIYEEYQGKDLPPEFGLKNLFRTRFGVEGRNTAIAYRVLMESADQAGFFATRGTRTHLIMPPIRKGSVTPPGEGDQGSPRGGGDLTPPPPPQIPVEPDQVKLEYVRKLISLLDSNSVDDRKELMERIERLLGT